MSELSSYLLKITSSGLCKTIEREAARRICKTIRGNTFCHKSQAKDSDLLAQTLIKAY